MYVEGHWMMHNGFGFGGLLFAVVLIVPFWKISQRAGFTPWLSLLILIPVVNVAFVYFLAFADWPARGRDGPPPGA